MYRLACAPGTVWDEVQLTCNWPHQVPSCASQVEEEGGSDDHVKEEDSTVEEEEEKQENMVKEEEDTVEKGKETVKAEEETVKEEGKEGLGDLSWSGVWSSHKCNAPGISAHTDQCSKFWLCRQLGEGEGLQVKSFSLSISIFESILPIVLL